MERLEGKTGEVAREARLQGVPDSAVWFCEVSAVVVQARVLGMSCALVPRPLCTVYW